VFLDIHHVLCECFSCAIQLCDESLSVKNNLEGGVPMFIGDTLPFVKTYVEEVDIALRTLDSKAGLTTLRKAWLGFCVLAIVVTNSVCWKRFERASLGRWPHARLSWLFRQPQRFWPYLLRASVLVLVKQYGISTAIVVFDDSEKPRSKITRRIYKAHRFKEKKSGGTVNGQSFVLLLLVTPLVTFPAGVEFYRPDPAVTAWNKRDRELKQQGVPAKVRPPKPPKDRLYPTKQEIALTLLEAFHTHFPQITIRCVLADTLYGTEAFLGRASEIVEGKQVISQLRKNQKVRFRGKELSVEEYVRRYRGVPFRIKIRGGDDQSVLVSSARLYVCAHKTKRFVIALKYEGEEEYRYLVATDMSWRTLDIVQAQTFRWLVEVFIQDWMSYEGWGQLTKQPDEDGSRCSLILSLLCDHCLLLHPEQLARFEHNLPACTVGSLCDVVKVESLLQCVWDIVMSEDPQERFHQLAKKVEEVFTLSSSTKHMVGRDLGRLEPTPSLEYRATVVMKVA
jgi:hypothetical protein